MRRMVGVGLILLAGITMLVYPSLTSPEPPSTPPAVPTQEPPARQPEIPPELARTVLERLEVKGRAPKAGYARIEFGPGWALLGGCDMRNIILHRDMVDVATDSCKVTRGVLLDPYTGQTMEFVRGPDTSDKVQIDHVVALSDAWQKGAQQLTPAERTALANDPLELLAVSGDANQAKGSGDAATWLPPNKAFRCQYIARQIAVKAKYRLWVVPAEKDAMVRILEKCPEQPLPSA